MRYSVASDVGRVRSKNEDSYLVLERGNGLYLAVADGLGGYPGGEVASHIAAETIRSAVLREEGEVAPSEALLAQAFLEADEAIRAAQKKDPGRRDEMSTTLSCVFITAQQALLAHIGDSRLYRVRDGHLSRLTRDHSVAEELVREGRIGPVEATTHPQRHLLTRALGLGGMPEVDTGTLAVAPGDRYLLCSDGIHHALADDAILALMLEEGARTADRLVAAAIEAGGTDNMTAVVVWPDLPKEAGA